MKAICLTSDPGNWLLPGFMHQWSKYCPALPMTIYGFTHPGLPNFVSIGDFADYPKQRWSDGLLRALDLAGDEIVLLMLEDYWLTRPADIDAIRIAARLMETDSTIARFDLTSDRAFSEVQNPRARQDMGSLDCLDIFESYSIDYRCSFQAALWRVSLLRQILRPGESPWETELNGTQRMADHGSWRVLGTYQWPLRYQIVVNKGGFDRTGNWMFPARRLSRADWAELDAQGFTQTEGLPWHA